MLARLIRIFSKLPHWLRPAVLGALLLFVVVSARMLFALPDILGNSVSIGDALGVLLGATCAGAVGGFGYTFVGIPARRIPVVGSYAAGIVTVTAYMVPLLLLAPYIFHESLVDDAVGVFSVVVVTIVFGVILGHTWFEE